MKTSCFPIGKENDEFIITDKQAMVKLWDSIIEMKKKNSKNPDDEKAAQNPEKLLCKKIKEHGNARHLKTSSSLTPWEELRDATATIS